MIIMHKVFKRKYESPEMFTVDQIKSVIASRKRCQMQRTMKKQTKREKKKSWRQDRIKMTGKTEKKTIMVVKTERRMCENKERPRHFLHAAITSIAWLAWSFSLCQSRSLYLCHFISYFSSPLVLPSFWVTEPMTWIHCFILIFVYTHEK